MITTTQTRTPVPARRGARVVLAVALALGAVATGANPASAAADHASGYAGFIASPVTTAALNADGTASITFPARRFTESSVWRDYEQRICGRFRLYRFDTDDRGEQRWVRDGQSVQCVTLKRSASRGAFRGVVFSGRDPGYAYSVDATYTWQEPGGKVVGSHYIDSRDASDYRCTTKRCTVEENPTYSAYVHFDV